MGSPLNDVRIANACQVAWGSMSRTEEEAVRWCGQCRQHVYDIASMTREAAEALLVRREGAACARIFLRKDGTVMTKECRQDLPPAPPAEPFRGFAPGFEPMMGRVVARKKPGG